MSRRFADCPPGIEGTVVDVRIFSRKGQEKDERAKQIEQERSRSSRRTSATKSAF
jgi:DNA-directed RNA polymerase subunit beta